MAQRLKDEADRFAAPGGAAIDTNIGSTLEKRGLRSGCPEIVTIDSSPVVGTMWGQIPCPEFRCRAPGSAAVSCERNICGPPPFANRRGDLVEVSLAVNPRIARIGDHPLNRPALDPVAGGGGAGRRLDRGRERQSGCTHLRTPPGDGADRGRCCSGAGTAVLLHADRADRKFPARPARSGRDDQTAEGV
jgi:hypothetical protein